MYFGIVGERKELVQEALSYIHAQDVVFHNTHTITFQSDYGERLPYCAALIKRGKVISPNIFRDTQSPSRIGVANKTFGSYLKKQHPDIAGFKIVDLIHTDKEIKELGSEIINIDNNNFGRVEGYQNIGLYEQIDFHKPVGGMGVGMMPSKLALTLINIGIGEYENHVIARDETIYSKGEKQKRDGGAALVIKKSVTIRDPFCGFGTTNFLAHHLGYHTIGSDINPTQAKQNRKRWMLHPLEQGLTQGMQGGLGGFSHSKNLGTFIKHDVTSLCTNPIFHHANIIVSEGYLGHIVTNKTQINEVEKYARQVKDIYTAFTTNITILAEENVTLKDEGLSQNKIIVVITIPVRLKYDLSISSSILNHFISLGWSARLISTPYSRPGQLVGRQVLIASILKIS